MLACPLTKLQYPLEYYQMTWSIILATIASSNDHNQHLSNATNAYLLVPSLSKVPHFYLMPTPAWCTSNKDIVTSPTGLTSLTLYVPSLLQHTLRVMGGSPPINIHSFIGKNISLNARLHTKHHTTD